MSLLDLGSSIGNFFSNLGTNVNNDLGNVGQTIGQDFSNLGSTVNQAAQSAPVQQLQQLPRQFVNYMNTLRQPSQAPLPALQQHFFPNQQVFNGSNFQNFLSQLPHGINPVLPTPQVGSTYYNILNRLAPIQQNFAQPTVQNRITTPLQNISKDFSNLTQNQPIQNKIGSVVNAGVNALQTPFLPSASLQAWNMAPGMIKSAVQSTRTSGNPIKGLKTGFTGETNPGLGTALTNNPTGQTVGNLAELPLYMVAGNPKQALNLVKNVPDAIALAANAAKSLVSNPDLAYAFVNEEGKIRIPGKTSDQVDNLGSRTSGTVGQKSGKVNLKAAQTENQTGKQLSLSLPSLSQSAKENSKTILPNGGNSMPANPMDTPALSGNIPQNLTKVEAKKVAANLGLQGKEPTIPQGAKNLGLVDTINNSPQTIKGLNMKGSYDVAGNKATQAAAQSRIATDPNGAYQFALNNHNAEANATAVLLAKQYEAAGQPQMAANLMIEKAKQALEAGQGNQIYSLWDKLSPETIAKTAQSTIDRYNATAKTKIPALTAEQYQNFVNQAKTIQGLTDARAKGIATQNLLRDIGRLIPSSNIDKGVALWRTGLLTGFRTPGKILLSHAISNTAEQVKNIPAKGIDMATSVFTGKRSLTPTLRGNAQGFKQGILAGVDNFVHGYNAPNSGGVAKDFTNQVNFGNSLFGKVAQKYVDQIGRLHGSLYKPFYGAAHLNSLYDQALTEARNQGLGGSAMEKFVQDFVANPPAKAAERAIKEAEYTTFQNKTALGQFAGGLHSSQLPSGVRAAGTVVAPFTQIPSSIAMKLVDYSPAGAVKTIIENIGKGNFDQRAFSQGLGRSITGTAVMAIGKALYDKGMMTLAYPTDKNEQALWKAQGKTADSILIGGKWRSLASLGPTGDALSVGGNFAAGMQGNKKTPGSVANAAIQAGSAGLSTIGNSPYLQDVNALAQTLIDPARSGLTFAKNMAGSVIPTGVANIATATDPLQRQTNTITDSITNKIPGLREQNLPSYDLFGQNVPRANGVVGSLFDPMYSSNNRTTPTLDELQRLQDSGNGATIQPLTKNQTIYGQKVNLNPQQLTQAMQTLGPQVQQAVNSVISSPAYQQLDDKQKAAVLSSAVTGIKGSDFKLNQVIQNPPPINTNSPQSNGIVPQVNAQTPSVTPPSTPSGTMDKYQIQMAKDQLSNDPTQNFKDLGTYVLRKDAQGNVTVQTKTAFNTALNEATMTNAKNSNDLSTWTNTANNLMQEYQTQLQDPNTDPLDKLTIQNKIDALQKNITKYQSYGGFTKGKAKPKIKIAGIKSTPLPKFTFKASKAKMPSLKLPKTPTLKVSKAPSVPTFKLKSYSNPIARVHRLA